VSLPESDNLNPVSPSEANPEIYDASNIKVLEGIEAVRKRPAMYIGDTSVRGLHHLVSEVVDNAIDEAMAGFCDRILVKIKADGSITVVDNGRGIPVDEHETGKPALEVVMTILHAGGKFEKSAYKVSGGLHGVGVSVVCALSEWLDVEVCREGEVYFMEFERGVKKGDMRRIGTRKKTGTTVSFKPDADIFTETTYRWETLATRMRELAYLNAGLMIRLEDERTDQKEEFHFKDGLRAFVGHLNEGKTVLHRKVISFESRADKTGLLCQIAFQYNDGYNENLISFANNINTIEGGTHLSGFRTALTRTLNAYARNKGFLKAGTSPPTGDDLREGLSAVVSVKVPEPQFEGQTKTKLGNSEVAGFVESTVNESLGNWLEEHPSEARNIV